MIEIKNDYYFIAMNDLLYLQSTLSFPGYNQISVQCQQIAEKLLKSVAEYVCTQHVVEILKSHNLKKIYGAIIAEATFSVLDLRDLAYLTDFYFDAKYPGDDFITVDRESCHLCLVIMYQILAAVHEFRKSLNLETVDYGEKML